MSGKGTERDHPKSCIEVAVRAALDLLTYPPAGPPAPIDRCNENHTVRFKVLWKPVSSCAVFTL